MSDFKPWREIKRTGKGLFCRITEKIHGTNAQIVIGDDTIQAGSRTKYLSPGKTTDNYGFAQWVEDNKADLMEKLGPGIHYGEWYGYGINHGYGLQEKRLALFNVKAFPPGRPLPSRIDVVPTLYEGPYSQEAVNAALERLKTSGSVLVHGCLKPEGIVIEFPAFGHSTKEVFEAEETGWTKAKGQGINSQLAKLDFDPSPYLQPIRLEKLLSRDSNYRENYPENLPIIAKDYISDLVKEDQLVGLDDVRVKAVKKAIYPWIRLMIE